MTISFLERILREGVIGRAYIADMTGVTDVEAVGSRYRGFATYASYEVEEFL